MAFILRQIKEIDMEFRLECSLINHFASIRDYRDPRWRRHLLLDVLMIALCATIGGAEGWEHIEAFGKSHQEWFEQFLELPHGIPHHDTFRRVFERVRPDHFESCFGQWISAIQSVLNKEIIAIDGKSMHGSYTNSSHKMADMLHIVSAWASENNLILGQIKTNEKSNEITAIPKLLECLMISGCIVTIDAMGCQRDIAKKIKEQKADYILAVKENQGALYHALKGAFDWAESTRFEAMVYDQCEDKDFAHGRIEKRKCTVLPMMYLHSFKEKWMGLTSLIRIERERIIKLSGEISISCDYYISSLEMDAPLILGSVREHWGIENKVHWLLDVVFREDDSRIRERNSAQNMTALRRMAINMIRRDTSNKQSIKIRRMMAGWDSRYLEKILTVN